MTNAMMNMTTNESATAKRTIRSTTSPTRMMISTTRKMVAFKANGTMQIESTGKFYSRFVEDNDLATIEIGELEDSQMLRIFRYMLNNGIVIIGDKYYAINNEGTKCGTLAHNGKVEIKELNAAMERYELCWCTSSQINSKTLLFCKSEKRKMFEKLISPGFIHEELAAGTLKEAMSFSSRMNTCSGATETLENTTPNDIGVVVILEKPQYRDGQFYGYFEQLNNNTAYQFRIYNGAGKGMLLNSKKLFKKQLAAALKKEYHIVGNPDNICAVMDLNSYKLNPRIAVSGNCHIMAEAHTSWANATKETVKALVQKGYNKHELQKRCEEEMLEAVYDAATSKDSDYILQAFAGVTQDATKKLIEDSLNKATFEFGAKYVKLLQAEDDIIVRYMELNVKQYICVDAPGIKEGLTLLERKPSTSMAESIVVYNLPGCYQNRFANTVMLPSCSVGLDMATCLGGADYDGDGVFIGHDEDIVKAMVKNGYKHKTIEVKAEQAANINISNYAELVYFLYTQQSANINRVVGTFKKFQFATKESLIKAFGGGNEIPRFGCQTINIGMVKVMTNFFTNNKIRMNSDEDVESIRRIIMEIARYMAETEIGFGKSGVHAPADVFNFFAAKSKEVDYDPSYDIDWNVAKEQATKYAEEYFAATRLINKSDVTMTTSANTIAKAMANIMRAKMNGHKMATLGFDAMIRDINDPVLTTDCIRAAYSKGYETSIMTDECLETLGYEVIDKNYNLNAVTVNIGRRVETSAIGARVSFMTDEKGFTWMKNTKSKALVLGPMPKNKDVYEIIDVCNLSAYADKNGVTRENTVVVLKRV